MKYIYICEDNNTQLQMLKQMASDYLSFHQDLLPPKIVTFTDPHDLLAAVRSQDTMNLYLLDVVLRSDIDGIELAEEIRRFDPRGFIIFVTTYDEYLPLTFQHRVEALNYIIKDSKDFRQQVFDALDRAFTRYKDFQSSTAVPPATKLGIKIGTTVYYINTMDFICVKASTQQHRLQLYTKEGVLEYYGTLSELKKQLSTKQFFQCHRSAIINLYEIASVDYKQNIITMSNHITVPLSTRKEDSFKKLLLFL